MDPGKVKWMQLDYLGVLIKMLVAGKKTLGYVEGIDQLTTPVQRMQTLKDECSFRSRRSHNEHSPQLLWPLTLHNCIWLFRMTNWMLGMP